LSEYISPQLFHFKIMGSGWERVIKVLRNKGFQVDYQSEFVYNEYTKLIPSLDFYFYMGQDEGSMGYIDALAAGVKTIVTPQGFHLDAAQGITYPFNTLHELVAVFNSLSQEKKQLIDSVSHWTWRHYAIKHLEIWNYLIDLKEGNTISIYKDGLNSLLSKEGQSVEVKRLTYHTRLYKGALKRTIYKLRTGFKDFETFRRKSRSFVRNLLK
jgi:hypothetical protein